MSVRRWLALMITLLRTSLSRRWSRALLTIAHRESWLGTLRETAWRAVRTYGISYPDRCVACGRPAPAARSAHAKSYPTKNRVGPWGVEYHLEHGGAEPASRDALGGSEIGRSCGPVGARRRRT